ncbi:F-box-like domain protein [Rhizoctonia solani 123E]|uniref:F-box-like domain protein n=1 Tax=Rhizoctonia solani 123E TaxID=1423351 RepID=A0A074SK62_9AGAM|nr:F-box-like domain protein [Rhizoctonia solani 123E]
MHFLTLPNEILAWAFRYLSNHELATISLLCRTWRVLAFPHLYKFISLSRKSHLESLAARITSDTGSGALSIIAHIRGISISTYDSDRGRAEDRVHNITESCLAHLKTIVPRLTQLKSLHWDLDFLPNDSKYLKLFQTHCPIERLEHVLSFPQISPSEIDQYITIFDFTNLSHVNFNLPGISFTSSDSVDCLPHLARLLTSCPNLVSLQLENATYDHISATNIVASLGNEIVFPRLRAFRITEADNNYGPDADAADWDGFFVPPGRYSHPLRLFFSRHKGIEDLALGWLADSVYEGDIDPEEMAQLFPSLKHLSGHAFLCNAITKSSIAQNLETLVVGYSALAGKKDWLAVMVAGLREMPKLRRLELGSGEYEGTIDPLELDGLLRMAPALEVLDCSFLVNNFTAMLLAISHAPRLRHIIVDGESWVASGLYRQRVDDSSYEDWETVIYKVALYCHRLERFQSWQGYACKTDWKIERDQNGKLMNVIAMG